MIHAVLHDAKDTVAVAVVEGLTAGTELSAWIMDETGSFMCAPRRTSPSATRSP